MKRLPKEDDDTVLRRHGVPDLDDEDEEETPRKGKGRGRGREESTEDAVDFDEATGGSDPKFPPCTVDLEFQSARMYWGDNPQFSDKALMFEASFKVLKVVDMPDELDEDEYEEDEDRPAHPVRKNEMRIIRLKVGPKKFKKPPPDAERVRSLAQALLRFVPKSKKAERAVDVKGNKVSWNEVIREEMCSEDNNLAGQTVRAVFSRFRTKRGKGNPMIRPTFSLPDSVEERENNIVDSL